MSPAKGLKQTIASALCQPFIGRTLAFLLHDRIPCRGGLVDTSSRLVTPKIKAMLFWRIYESAEIRFIQQYLRPDLDVIELGSSIGVLASQIRRRIDDERKLITVEANPELAEQIKINVNLNTPGAQLSVINKAIDYDPSGRRAVAYSAGNSTLAGHIAEQNGDGSAPHVKTTTLAQICEEYLPGKPYVLVSDIEGAEAGIALCELDALKFCQQMIIELHATVFNREVLSIEQLSMMFIDRHGFVLRDHYGSVYVFEKPQSELREKQGDSLPATKWARA